MVDKRTFFVVGLLALITVGFFHDVIFLGNAVVDPSIIYRYEPWRSYYNGTIIKTFFGDIPFEFLSFEYFNTISFRRGEIPLWNPYIFSGYPHLANSLSAVFYPPQVLLLFLSPLTVHNITVILQFFLAGVFMFFFCREIKISCFGAAVGALVFMLGGFNVAWMGWRTFVGAGMWLPLILLFLERFFRVGGLRHVLLAGVFLGLSFLAGMMQITVYVLIASAFFIINGLYARSREDGFKGLAKTIPYTLLFLITGFSIAAVQILPTLELSQQSQRVAWDVDELSFMPAQHVLNFFMPEFFDDIPDDYTGVLEWQGGFLTHIDIYSYMGFLSFFLVLFTLFFSTNKHKEFFVCFTALILLLIFGSKVYLLFYYAVPVFQRIGPVRIIFLFNFSASVLSAMGAMVLTEGRFYKSGNYQTFLKILRFSYVVGFVILRQNIWIFLACIIVIELLIRKRLSKQAAMVMLILLILIDLIPAAYNFYPRGDPSLIFPKTASLLFLQKNCGQPSCRILEVGNTMFSNSNMFFGLQSVKGYDSLYPGRYCKLIDENCLKESAIQLRPVNWVYVDESYDMPLFDLLNVKYIVSDKPIGSEEEVLTSTKNLGINETLVVDLEKDSSIASLKLVSYISWNSWVLEQGEEVGKVVIVDDENVEHVFPIRAGVDTAARNHDDPRTGGKMRHDNARIFKSTRVDGLDDRRIWFTHVYYTDYFFDEPVVPVKMKVSYSHPLGSLYIQQIYFTHETGRFREVESKDMRIYENTHALPRAFIIGKTRVIENETLLIEHLRSGNFNPWEAVILEEEIDYTDTNAWGTAEIVDYAPERVHIKAGLNEYGLLVLSDQYYPGWRVYVDGVEQKIHRAYYILRAVKLDAGTHDVVFEYDPMSYKIGLWVTIASVFCILLYFILEHRTKKTLKPKI